MKSLACMRAEQVYFAGVAKPPRSFGRGGFVVLMRWVIMYPAAEDLNLRLAVFGLSGGWVYSILMA